MPLALCCSLPATGLCEPPAAQRAACTGKKVSAAPPTLWRECSLRCAAACLAGLVSTASLQLPAAASIPLGRSTSAEEAQRAWAVSQLGGRYVSRQSQQAPAPEAEPTSVRIQRLQQLMQEGNAAALDGDYATALANYDSVIAQFPDFATTEYSRLARGIVLYQLGRTSDAILQLEDLEVALRGYAEVHAALAAILYVERPMLLQVAEQQWEIAMEFNRNFADPKWVLETKHWPPRLMAALDRFLNLR